MKFIEKLISLFVKFEARLSSIEEYLQKNATTLELMLGKNGAEGAEFSFKGRMKTTPEGISQAFKDSADNFIDLMEVEVTFSHAVYEAIMIKCAEITEKLYNIEKLKYLKQTLEYQRVLEGLSGETQRFMREANTSLESRKHDIQCQIEAKLTTGNHAVIFKLEEIKSKMKIHESNLDKALSRVDNSLAKIEASRAEFENIMKTGVRPKRKNFSIGVNHGS